MKITKEYLKKIISESLEQMQEINSDNNKIFYGVARVSPKSGMHLVSVHDSKQEAMYEINNSNEGVPMVIVSIQIGNKDIVWDSRKTKLSKSSMKP